MARRGGVHHHELPLGLPNQPRKRLKYRNFLGAGRAQVFFQQGAARVVQIFAFGLEDVLAVIFCFGVGVNAADRQVRHLARQRLIQVRGGVGGGQVNGEASLCQRYRQGCGHRRFAHAALAHRHNQAAACLRQFVYQGAEGGEGLGFGLGGFG